jgi:PAS domain S-box-containing protein
LFNRQRIKRAASEEVLRQMPAGVVIAEAPSGKIIFVNRQTQRWTEEYLGLSIPSEPGDSRDLQERAKHIVLFRPDGRASEPEDRPLIRSIRDGEEVRDEEFIYPLADGKRLWYRANSSPIYDEEGRIVAGILVAQDITEQKRVEERLRFQAHLLDAVGQAVTAIDMQGKITYWNRRAQDLYGWSAEEVMDRLAVEVLVSEDQEERAGEIRSELRAGRSWSGEFVVRRRDGTTFPAMVTDTPVHDERGELIGIIGVSTDITERKRAEKEIERRTHQQAVVAELGLQALANNGLQSLMDEAVACVARTLGVEYAKIVELLPGGEELLLRAGTGFEEGLVGRAREPAGLRSQAGYTLLSEEPVIVEDLATETRFNPPPLVQERGAVSGMTVVIPGRDGAFGVLGVHTTRRRIFSEDDVNFLQAVANVLATAIEREGAQERVEEGREAERSRISRDIHDEALQELTDALVQAQQIQRTSEDPQQTLRLARLLATLDRIGPHLRGAVYDLRLEGEETKLFPELLESLVELHRGMAPESDIALEVHDGVLSGPLGERGRQLLRILGEALTNVRRHSGASHVRVGVGITEEKLWAEVQDDGRGFDAAQQEEDSEEALSATGGLGIRGMMERARALGGDLKIESDPQTGTRVRFEMTLTPEREEPEEHVYVLLVEDHATVREALAAAFEWEGGFEVVGQAGSLSEAREMLGAEPAAGQVDVAVVDLGLPDGYGGDLIRELWEANPRAQALVLSASLEQGEIARAVEAGAAGVLSKTAHLDEVVRAVKRLRAGEPLMPLEEVVKLLRYASSRREEEIDARRAAEKLTPREIEVLQALAEGLGSEEIAERLHISLRTERNHMANILSKLGVHSQLQALVFALRYGVVEIP